MTESRREVLALARMGKRKPGKSGLTPFRLFDTMEDADKWISEHQVGWQIVKIEVTLTELEDGNLRMVFYDPNGAFEKYESVLSAGLYHSLKKGYPHNPDTEKN